MFAIRLGLQRKRNRNIEISQLNSIANMDQAKSQTARGMLDIARSSLDEEVREVEGVSTRTEDEWKFYLNTDPSVILIDGRHVYSREPMSLESLSLLFLRISTRHSSLLLRWPLVPLHRSSR